MDNEIMGQVEREFAEAKAWGVSKGFSVGKIKVCKFMSEETICFTADVLLNGRKVGTASNEGHGGPTSVHLKGGTVGSEHLAKLEMFVDEAVSDYESKKEDEAFLRRAHKTAQRKALNLLIIKGKPMSYLMTTAATKEEAISQMKKAPAGECEFFVYRSGDAVAAAKTAKQEKFMAKCRAKSFETGLNMVVVLKDGWVSSVHYTSRPSLEDFKAARPEVVGSLEFEPCPKPGLTLMPPPGGLK